jgi:hypothetical protein
MLLLAFSPVHMYTWLELCYGLKSCQPPACLNWCLWTGIVRVTGTIQEMNGNVSLAR